MAHKALTKQLPTDPHMQSHMLCSPVSSAHGVL